MSDKKQPAQQRVNVRIVKADDPEQRGGMKPIAKADGSLQISPEEACTAGIWTKPPFDLRGLSKMVDESTILPQCIRAYKSNIAGFGIDIRYKDDFADADETPEMKAEWDRATEVVEMLNMEQVNPQDTREIMQAEDTLTALLKLVENRELRDAIDRAAGHVAYLREVAAFEAGYGFMPE